jgi:hypothetical protein
MICGSKMSRFRNARSNYRCAYWVTVGPRPVDVTGFTSIFTIVSAISEAVTDAWKTGRHLPCPVPQRTAP